MKLIDLLNSKRFSLSFEVFPPRSSDSFDSIRGVIEEISALRPAFMSVTYGAGGGVGEYTLDIAREIKEKYGVPSLAHLTCISSTRATVQNELRRIREAGVENVMALRGDLQPGQSLAGGEYRYAAELVRDIKAACPELCIGAACYPETHPESHDQKEDIMHLKEKVEAGCDFLTTQMFFDNNLLYSFLYKIREAGVSVPVVAGVMPITNTIYLERAMKLSGSFIPQRFRMLVDKFGQYPEAMKQAGIAYATDQIIDLFANGVNHVHIYTMNKPEVAAQIQANLSEILGKEA